MNNDHKEDEGDILLSTPLNARKTTPPAISSHIQSSNHSNFQANFEAKMQHHASKRDYRSSAVNYMAPMHESDADVKEEEYEQFSIHPSAASSSGRNHQSGGGYMYLSQNSEVQDQEKLYDGIRSSSHVNSAYAGAGDYTVSRYLKESILECCVSFKKCFGALPRWLKLFTGTFGALWLFVVVVRHKSTHKGSNSSNGDDNGGGDSNSNSTNISSRNLNAMMHNCIDVGDYYFGDKVVEYEGHSYQMIGIVNKDSYNHEHSRLSFFESLIQARMRCLNGNVGYLTVIDDQDENDFVANYIRSELEKYNDSETSNSTNTTVTKLWLGGNDMTNSGDFQWLSTNSKSDGLVFWNSGQEVSGVYNNFDTNSTQNAAKSELNRSCVYMQVTGDNSTSGLWFEESCHNKIDLAIIEYDGLLTPATEL